MSRAVVLVMCALSSLACGGASAFEVTDCQHESMMRLEGMESGGRCTP